METSQSAGHRRCHEVDYEILGDDMQQPVIDTHVTQIIGNLLCTDQRRCKIVDAFHG